MTKVQIPLTGPVVSDPKILGGTPVIKGTRIPASLVLDLYKSGYSQELIQVEYPSLTKSRLKAFFSEISL